jgi:hypothetical protein
MAVLLFRKRVAVLAAVFVATTGMNKVLLLEACNPSFLERSDRDRLLGRPGTDHPEKPGPSEPHVYKQFECHLFAIKAIKN